MKKANKITQFIDAFLYKFTVADFFLILSIAIVSLTIMFVKVDYCIKCRSLENDKQKISNENNIYKKKITMRRALLSNLESPEIFLKKVEKHTNLIFPNKKNIIRISYNE